MPDGRDGNVVLVTGATGFLGTQIVRLLLARGSDEVNVLVRAQDDMAAERHLARAWWDWPDLAAAIGSRILVVRGDVTEADLGLDPQARRALVTRLTHVIHTAADLRLDAPLEEMRRVNVQGTANVLAVAEAAHAHHGLSRFAHVSTAYVAGRRQGYVDEGTLDDSAGFNNSYEQSKFEAERLLHDAAARLPISIFRPGMVVGDSETGAIKTFNTLYFALRLYLSGKLRLLPAAADLKVNMVPVDYVASAIANLAFQPEAAGLTFHLTAPMDSLPTARQLVEYARKWARQRLGVSLPPPIFVPLLGRLLGGTAGAGAAEPASALAGLAARLAPPELRARLRDLAPYFGESRRFGRDNADRLCPYSLDWRQFLAPIMEYGVRYGFLHRSERTVHEQALFRLGSKSRPVRYYDIIDGRAAFRSAADVRRDVLTAAASLRRLGVEAGDRVAIVGLNSTRYLTLDLAIGLVGAVSVPMYYTSPPAELDQILAAGGAKLLLVGAPGVLRRLGEMTTTVGVVSFCRDAGSCGATGRPVMAWREFLSLGEGDEKAPAAPVVPDDVATLRYSSGTTGLPKGVAFTHRQLRWMGECMATLPPWRQRTRRARWLSFLPMNHVVEGILGTYSPYYVPAAVDIYYLESFRGLTRALPLVRPSVFFSVPRFYQKLWQAFTSSTAGRVYLGAPGRARRLLQPLLKRALLAQAGLDRCCQLIAGSAPSDAALMRSFRDLGIEVHDAYGLTEAPLITINRLGANRIGTVGEPLPETEVRIDTPAMQSGATTAGSGEVLVRGPQVMLHYHGGDVQQPFRDGWLLTGDLGHLTPAGSLVLDGRKSEMLITAYGKNVHPGKLEAMLQTVPGISQALVVGESRPYCVALLWPEGGGIGDYAALDAAIANINLSLSHPEQVRRWAVLANDLTPEAGVLTANLKLRRQVVADRYAETIAALYAGGEMRAGVLHVGESNA